ncbi:MAG: hypothetical protein VB878_22025 [Pirellulaceae bacterium]
MIAAPTSISVVDPWSAAARSNPGRSSSFKRAALGYDARPDYHKPTAKTCRKAGMDVLACTPERLADCMAEIIRA